MRDSQIDFIYRTWQRMEHHSFIQYGRRSQANPVEVTETVIMFRPKWARYRKAIERTAKELMQWEG